MSEVLPIRKDWLAPVPFNIWTGKDPKSGEYENIMPYGRYFTEIMHWINDVEKEVIYLDDDGAECTIEPTKWYRYLSEKKKQKKIVYIDALDGYPLFDNYICDIGKAINKLRDIFEGKGETEGADWPALVTPQGRLYDKNIQALREGLLGIDYLCFGYVGESKEGEGSIVYRFEWWPRFLNAEEMIRVRGSLLDENYKKIAYYPYPECGILQYFDKYLIRKRCYYDDNGNPVYSIIFDYLYNDVEKISRYISGQWKTFYYCCRADEHKVYRYDEKGVFDEVFVVKRLEKDEGWQEYTAFKVSQITAANEGCCTFLSTGAGRIGVYRLYGWGSTKEFQLIVDCDLSAQDINLDSIKNVSSGGYASPAHPGGGLSPDECKGTSVSFSFIDGDTKFNYRIYPSVVVDKNWTVCDRIPGQKKYFYYPHVVRMEFPTSVNSNSLVIKGLASGNSLSITKGKKTVGVSYAYTATRSERTFRKWEKFKEKEMDGMFSTWEVDLFRPYPGTGSWHEEWQYWDEDTGEELDPPIFLYGWITTTNMVTVGLDAWPLCFKDNTGKRIVMTGWSGESGKWTYGTSLLRSPSGGPPRVYKRSFKFETTNEETWQKGIQFDENQDYDYWEEDWVLRESIKVSGGDPSLSDYNGARAFLETSYPLIKTGDIFLMSPPLNFSIWMPYQITLGEPMQCIAYGRVPPYTWEVSDPTIARITDKGTNNVEVTVKGRKVGKFYLRVTDSVGQKGCSRMVSVVE